MISVDDVCLLDVSPVSVECAWCPVRRKEKESSHEDRWVGLGWFKTSSVPVAQRDPDLARAPPSEEACSRCADDRPSLKAASSPSLQSNGGSGAHCWCAISVEEARADHASYGGALSFLVTVVGVDGVGGRSLRGAHASLPPFAGNDIIVFQPNQASFQGPLRAD